MSSLGPIQNVGPAHVPMPVPSPSSMVPAPPAPSASPSAIQQWIATHRKALAYTAGGLALLGAGVAGYRYYYASQAGRIALDDDEEATAGSPSGASSAAKDKKRRKKKSKAAGEKKGVNDEGGPLLEEISPPATPAVKQGADAGAKSPAVDEDKKDDLPAALSASDIEAMSVAERTSLATHLKTKGNALFSKKSFREAIECYSQAIAVSPTESAVFYSNRAASYNSLTPPEHDKVVADCDSALKLDPAYIKALKRRAAALEALERDEEAIRDYTAVTLLEAFEPPKKVAPGKENETGEQLERVIKKTADKQAKELLRTRPPQLPSTTFILAYLDAFRPHAAPELPENPNTADEVLVRAFQALDAQDYAHAFTLAQEALTQGLSPEWKDGKAEGLNLRGTFKFLINDRDGAKADFEESITLDPKLIQSRVKLASVHMELGNITDTFGDFEAAIAEDATDPDIYYHRGQVYFIAGELDKALDDYTKSSELDPTFIFSHIQKAVTLYRQGKTAPSMAEFRRVLKQFPDRSEPYNYYGELLLAENRFGDALEKFEKAVEIEAKKGGRQNVLPMVNKANTVLREHNDLAGCEKLVQEALAIDPDCDVAIITLAQLSLQQSKIEQAVTMFGRAREIARTEEELVQAITFEHATKAQVKFMETYPEQHAKFQQMMSVMQAQQQAQQ